MLPYAVLGISLQLKIALGDDDSGFKDKLPEALSELVDEENCKGEQEHHHALNG
jgi:hypothetical protein